MHFPVTALGPGNRLGVWFQGCSIQCPGCISRDTWEFGTGLVEIELLLAHIAAYADADGLTVSGGEPFDQPEALCRLLKHWREVSSGTVLVFTGFELADVAPWLKANPGLVDALVTGRYRSEVPQTKALRGSDNQRLVLLTDEAMAFAAYDQKADSADRRLDVMFDQDGDAWFAGIPARGAMGRLRRALATSGHAAETSDMRIEQHK
ncbi:4Fe-4S single cluster domain-containing protein [Novosphingobium sp. PASSN1]|uniref:4Fe-4S single cluster domain-containing protein n=1 Tax=Novosphingobium sp. PASSN1 TaxID=2015561 RepID=UPI0025FCCF4A|nr:4Fe-4S single cluster domain-containing protein [Novosphingobium sp. PASSN1]